MAPALVVCAAATASHAGASRAAELTIDRLFDAPALAGPTVIGLRISPDGSSLTYLQGKPEDKDRLDLWAYDLKERRARLLVDSRALAPVDAKLSDEEIGRRERQRTAALSGILEYSFAPSGQALLFPLDGRLYYYDLSKPPQHAVLTLTPPDAFAVDATISPHGGYVAYVRDQNLHIYDLAARADRALTQDGAGAIKNGIGGVRGPGRNGPQQRLLVGTGRSHVAFVRVDESPVKVTQRFEIAADNVETFAQRYPATGGPNVSVRLGVSDVRTGEVVWIDLGAIETSISHAWTGCPTAIPSRSNARAATSAAWTCCSPISPAGRRRLVLSETSASWIELNDELVPQAKQRIRLGLGS